MAGNFFDGQFFGGGFFGAITQEESPRPSGGVPATLRVKPRSRRDIAAERAKYGIPDKALEVITKVAESQVARLENDDQKRYEELTRELELSKVKFDGRYLEVLAEIRTRLIDQEIAALLNRSNREDEEIMVLMMMSVAVA